MNAYAIGAIGHGNNTGSSGQVDAMNATVHGSNTAGSSGQTYSPPINLNPTGATGHGNNTGSSGQVDAMNATGHGSNTNESSQIDAIDYSNSNSTEGQVENKPTINTDAVGHSSTVYSSGQVENKPTINPDAVGHNTKLNDIPKKEAIPDLYMQDGNDYYIDDTALSNAQMKTGDDKKADSVVGSGGGGSETNSNINTGVFGGSARAAHPGYSLW